MPDQKRILYLTLDFIKPIFSGNGQLSRIQVLGLAERGYEVMVLCPKGPIDLDVEALDLISRKKLSVIQIDIGSKKDLSIHCDWQGYFELGQKIFNQIEEFNPNLIIATDWHTSDLAIFLKKRLKIPILAEYFRIFSFYEEYFDIYSQYSLIRKKEEEMIRFSDSICVLSSFDGNWVTKHDKIGSSKVFIMHPPVSDQFLRKLGDFVSNGNGGLEPSNPKDKEKYKLMTLSRIVREKKIHRILPVISELKKSDLRFEYSLYGEILDDDYWEKLQNDIGRFELDDRINFTGKFLDLGVISVFNQSDCYLHTSEYEPYGITIIEAALVGCPIFIDKKGLIGAAEVLIQDREESYGGIFDGTENIDGSQGSNKPNESINYSNIKNGLFLLDFNEPILAAKMIKKALENPKLLKKIADNAKKYAEKLTINNYITLLSNIIEE